MSRLPVRINIVYIHPLPYRKSAWVTQDGFYFPRRKVNEEFWVSLCVQVSFVIEYLTLNEEMKHYLRKLLSFLLLWKVWGDWISLVVDWISKCSSNKLLVVESAVLNKTCNDDVILLFINPVSIGTWAKFSNENFGF